MVAAGVASPSLTRLRYEQERFRPNSVVMRRTKVV